MKAKAFALALLALSSCARIYQVSLGADEVELFYREAEVRGYNLRDHDLIVKPGTLSGNTIGLCQLGGGPPTVTIDAEFWDTADADEREVLVFHELGHCLLDRPHVDDHLAIMSSYLLSSSYYAANKTALIDELFR